MFPDRKCCRWPEYKTSRCLAEQQSRFPFDRACRHRHRIHGEEARCKRCFHILCHNPYFCFPVLNIEYRCHTNRTFQSFQGISFFIFRNRFVVLSIPSAKSIWKMSLSKTQIFLFFESGNYVKATRFFTEFQVKCRNFKKIAFDHCKTCSERFVIWRDNFSFIFQRKEDKEMSEKRCYTVQEL